MKLRELLEQAGCSAPVPDADITGIEIDSRRVQPGNLFVALPCERAEAHVQEALAKGAAAVLDAHSVKNLHAALVCLCKTFYAPLPHSLLAVTGTNGKSSTVSLASQLLPAIGCKAANVGTLGVHIPQNAPGKNSDETLPAPDMTTYDMPVLYHLLHELALRHVACACIEATSHGLDQGRLDGLRFQAGALTNITQDHLDYHGTMVAYARAKRRLFESGIEEKGAAILNRSSAFFETFHSVCHERNLRTLTYGLEREDVDLAATNLREEGTRTVFTLSLLGERFTDVSFRLIGRFQVENLLCALGLILGAFPEADRSRLVDALASLQAIPGRMEALTAPNGARVFVDFCHTPDALARALTELRRLTPRRLIVLFGCGGERDHGKRPLMAQIAEQNADCVIVTDDNPRSEDPASIRAEIASGLKRPFVEIPGRKIAIERALSDLTANDILLIAGRGHETFQKIGTERIPFRDRDVVEAFGFTRDTPR